MGKYVHYSDEQMETANSVRISEILDREGEKYKKWGRQLCWLRHDSVVFSGSKWFRHSEGEGGRAIGFCKKFFGMNFQEAMEYLLDFRPEMKINLTDGKYAKMERKMAPGQENGRPGEKREKEPAELILPPKNETMKCAYRYLIKERHLDPEVVSFFAHEGSIYEDKAWHGVVFLGKDGEGNVRNAHVRGTMDASHPRDGETREFAKGERKGTQGDGKFRMTCEGSDSNYGFGHVGSGNLLYAFEAPIDLLSFVSYRRGWRNDSYVALNGVSGNAIFRFMEEHPNVNGVVLCLDNDDPGERASMRIARELRERGVNDVRRLCSIRKDWNEDLTYIHNRVSDVVSEELATEGVYVSGKSSAAETAELMTAEEGGNAWGQSLC